MAPFTVPVENG